MSAHPSLATLLESFFRSRLTKQGNASLQIRESQKAPLTELDYSPQGQLASRPNPAGRRDRPFRHGAVTRNEVAALGVGAGKLVTVLSTVPPARLSKTVPDGFT